MLGGSSLPRSRRARGVLAAVVAYLVWGFLSPGAKLLLEYGEPWTLNLLRVWLSVLVLAVFLGPSTVARTLRALTRDWRLWVLGTGGMGLPMILFFESVDRLEPSIATALLYFGPFIIAWAAHRLFGEHIDWKAPAAAAVTLLGVLLAVLGPVGGLGLPVGEWTGLGIGILSVGGWIFYTLYLRHLADRYNVRELALGGFIASGVFFALGTVAIEGYRFTATSESLGILAAYVLLPSVLSFFLYTTAVRMAGATITAVLIGIELVATAFVSAWLTQEPFGTAKVIGLVIVALAATWFAVAEARRNRRVPPDEAHA